MATYKWDIERFIKSKITDGAYMNSCLDAGAFSFTVKASSYALDKFKQSFADGGFYKQGAWAPRKRVYNHPILKETGDLSSLALSKVYTRKNRYKKATIRTTERYGNRRNKTDIGYAAVHNDPTGFRVNQHSSATPTRRQFMGHNEALYREIRENYESLIFSRMNNI